MASTKPREDWDEIRLDYIAGMAVRDIGAKYNIDYTQVIRKAKQKGWGEHKILTLQETPHHELLPDIIEQANKDEVMMELYKISLLTIQQKFASLIEKAINQIEHIIDTSPDGLYTSSSKSDGSATYERITRFVDDLAPFFTDSNKSLGIITSQVTIQNSVGANADNVKFNDNVVDASREYQDFIKNSK